MPQIRKQAMEPVEADGIQKAPSGWGPSITAN